MIIHDISQELLTADTYPGDPSPSYTRLLSLSDGADYNLSRLQLGVHNGTHIDAPSHYIKGGKNVDQIELQKCIGMATVVEFEHPITAREIEKLKKRQVQRVLFKGKATLTLEATREIGKSDFLLVGTELLTIGNDEETHEIHRELLSKEIVILENLQLRPIPEGEFLLIAIPLKISDIEGSPCRAVLIEKEKETYF